MKRRDVLIVVAVLAVAAALLLVRQVSIGAGDIVVIRVDGQEYVRAPLGEARAIMVETPGGGYNEVVVSSGGVYVRSASCPDKSCVKQGEITPDNVADRYLKNLIICLPNRVVVELVTEGEAQ